MEYQCVVVYTVVNIRPPIDPKVAETTSKQPGTKGCLECIKNQIKRLELKII